MLSKLEEKRSVVASSCFYSCDINHAIRLGIAIVGVTHNRIAGRSFSFKEGRRRRRRRPIEIELAELYR
jgi:hypothetical protein